MSLLVRLECQQNFTPLEKEIADFVIHHKEEIANLTITELANLTYSSPSTISRFCKKIGERNYNDFRVHIASAILNNQENEIDYNRPFSSNDSTKQIAHKIEILYQTSIEETKALLDDDIIDEITQLIIKKGSIDIYATAELSVCGLYFVHKMMNTPVQANMMHMLVDFRKWASFSDKNTLALVISYSGNEKIISESVEIIKANGGTVISITSIYDNPLKEKANYHLSICSKENDALKIESYSSKISTDYILDILFSKIFSMNYDINLIQKLTREKKYKLKK
ncbi:MAG: MurR/RpiR family transcriptional regulator [Faecalibacillus sp.]